MGFLDLIFPKTCLSCGRDGKYICKSCLEKTKFLPPVCPYCERASIDGFTHSKCRKKYGLDGLISIWKYEGIIKKAILALKYRYSLEVGQELVGAYIDCLRGSSYQVPNSGTLIPIPIHWYRKNYRGFNQSEEIGKVVAKELGCKFIPDFLYRTKSVTPQVELSVKERKQNLKGVFAINPDYKSIFKNLKSIIVFDDVFTTGSTLKEAAKVLKKTGVGKVWGMTIAR